MHPVIHHKWAGKLLARSAVEWNRLYSFQNCQLIFEILMVADMLIIIDGHCMLHFRTGKHSLYKMEQTVFRW